MRDQSQKEFQSMPTKFEKKVAEKKKVSVAPKNKFLLSKTSTSVFTSTPFPKEICNIIGQFLGKDIPFFQVGDTYIEALDYIKDNPYKNKAISIRTVSGYRIQCDVRQFWTYTVVRRTACMIKVQPIARYRAFLEYDYDWSTLGFDEYGNLKPRRFNEHEVVLFTKESTASNQYRLKPTTSKASICARHAEIDRLGEAHGVQDIMFLSDVKYNTETKRFDVQFGRNVSPFGDLAVVGTAL